MVSKPKDDLPPPQIEEALRRIAECKRSRAEELDLGGLHLREIPEQVAELTWLKRLHCGLAADARKKDDWQLREKDKKSCNVLHTLPTRVLAGLQHLEELDLRHNRLTALPPEIGRLTALTQLLLGGNQLAALPPQIGSLATLTHLSLDNNQLATLPSEIGRLAALTHLSLDSNQLAALPSEIGRLAALTHLSLDSNQLAALPPDIASLTGVMRLSLNHNRLAAPPPEIHRLTSLTHLALSHNQLAALPPEIGRLTALTDLALHRNRLAALPPEIGLLAALRYLWLDGNQLAALPPEIGQLTALTDLWLDNNQLAALPPEIGRLAALRYLWLRSNQLAALPPEIGCLAALKELRVAGNPLQSPPPEIVKQGVDAIRKFLNAATRTGRPAYEAKVILVGEAGVGKTQLREWILAGKFREPGLSTRLLEVRACTIENPHDKSQPGRLNIWDFGGQDDYRPSQQLFFTDGALYLMLFNGRKGLADGRVEEWLRLIRLRVGKHARVLLVATNALPTDVSPNLNELPRHLLEMCVLQPDGRPFQINSKLDKDRPISGLTGAQGLVARIHQEATALPAFTAEWPAEWLAARDAALDPKTYSRDEGGGRMPSVIRFNRFGEIAKAKGVSEDQVLILARALSDSGRLTYKGSAEAPNQIVVLDSEWLMKTVAYVLAAPEVKAAGGVLHRRDLNRIWVTHKGLAGDEQPTVYPEDLHEDLLRQMTQHDISYRLDENRWLIGQCVRDTMPKPMPWTFREREAGGTVLGLSCQLTDKIHGLTSLLTVRNHYHHVNHREHAWQRGVFLRNPERTAEGVLRVDGERRVDFETRGPDAGPFIGELKGSLDKIIADTWRAAGEAEVKPYRYAVPCPTCEQGSYGYDDLRADFREGETTAKCENGKRCANNIQGLLEGFSRATDPDPAMRALLRAAYNEPPHIITVTKVSRAFGLMGERARVDIHCEYTERTVEGATETIALDSELWVKLKEWGPGLFVAGVKVWMGLDPTVQKRHGVRQNEDLAAAVEKTGRLERAPNTFIENAFGEFLAKTARKGDMTQVEMNNDGRLLWVAPNVALGQDPNEPKSQRSGKA